MPGLSLRAKSETTRPASLLEDVSVCVCVCACGTTWARFHFQMQALSVGSKFEAEIREEKEEKKRQEVEKKQRQAAFKQLQSAFCSWPPARRKHRADPRHAHSLSWAFRFIKLKYFKVSTQNLALYSKYMKMHYYTLILKKKEITSNHIDGRVYWSGGVQRWQEGKKHLGEKSLLYHIVDSVFFSFTYVTDTSPRGNVCTWSEAVSSVFPGSVTCFLSSRLPSLFRCVTVHVWLTSVVHVSHDFLSACRVSSFPC